ncbi:MAG: hypothetical protein LBB53_02255 [Prevotellaceae bacterium]|jgi:hypothetical protein|nr:hypothetical protein [Prevotellaceae bacterium]
MKKIILIALMFFCANSIFTQRIYYGFPDTKAQLTKNSILIVNLFNDYNMDGRIDGEDAKIDTLCAILNNNQNLYFNIEINFFGGSHELCLKFSQSLCQSLEKILQREVKICNYKIHGNGNTNPIFCSDNKSYIYIYNNRIEIFITENQ